MSPSELAALAASICPSDPPDLGIVRAVRVLMDAGIKTFESCEGGDAHAFRHPTVKFYGIQSDGWRALAACQAVGLPVSSLERAWDIEDGEPSGPYWQIVFRRRLD